jgi:hypothetical protein
VLCAVAVCLVPSGALANAAFERGVNVHLRAYEACAKAPAARASQPARQACAAHLAAAREGMVRLGYAPGQAERHVSFAHDQVIAPRVRAFFERSTTAARPPAPVRAEAQRAPKPMSTEAPALAAQLAEWSLCLEKARADVLAYPLRPDLDVAGTAGAIVRACNGYEGTVRELHVAAGRSEAEALEAVRAVAERARAGAAAEIARRLARTRDPRETASIGAAR